MLERILCFSSNNLIISPADCTDKRGGGEISLRCEWKSLFCYLRALSSANPEGTFVFLRIDMSTNVHNVFVYSLLLPF